MLTIKLTGVDDAIKMPEDQARLISDHRAFFRIMVIPELKRYFRDVFSTEGFGEWPPLAASTLAEKRRKGFSSAPLVRTTVYRASSTGLRSTKVRRNVIEITSQVPYAKYHELGTRYIPKREVFEKVADKIRPELPKLWIKWQRRQTR